MTCLVSLYQQAHLDICGFEISICHWQDQVSREKNKCFKFCLQKYNLPNYSKVIIGLRRRVFFLNTRKHRFKPVIFLAWNPQNYNHSYGLRWPNLFKLIFMETRFIFTFFKNLHLGQQRWGSFEDQTGCLYLKDTCSFSGWLCFPLFLILTCLLRLTEKGFRELVERLVGFDC